jgi:hypothetical protein
MKQIISFSFKKETISTLDKICAAYGKNRSNFLETLITDFYTPEIQVTVDAILKMQEKLASSKIENKRLTSC